MANDIHQLLLPILNNEYLYDHLALLFAYQAANFFFTSTLLEITLTTLNTSNNIQFNT